MINLTEEQLEFLEKELNITLEQIERMNKAEWRKVREACYDIVLDEMLDENDEYNEAGDGSERCSLAGSVMNTLYKELQVPRAI